MDFVPFQKIGRLSREIVVTEKIDGTNAQLYVALLDSDTVNTPFIAKHENGNALWAGSRNRFLTPQADNFGFAKWAQEHAADLFALGEGRHFGEWWGSGIQRGYGLQGGEKRFSLFNVTRWCARGTAPKPIPSANPTAPVKMQEVLPACVDTVPVLYRGEFSQEEIETRLEWLRSNGSYAEPGFRSPEGIVVFHTSNGALFKKTLDKDDEPKGRG